MNNFIYDRVINESKYIIDTGSTVREVADVFGVSKSTVHNDMRKRLINIDINLYEKVSSILEYHTDIKHFRGGESTKRKYLVEKS